MSHIKLPVTAMSFATVCLFFTLGASVLAPAQNEVVLHRFHLSDGALPQGALIADAQQNLYGVTVVGGGGSCIYRNLPAGCGTVFELTQMPGGGWNEEVLYAFQGGSDGAFPMGGLVLDNAGNLYGTTSTGGLTSACSGSGCGTVFELSPPQQGNTWSKTVLYQFTDGLDGDQPESSLIFDQSGNLYGTAYYGGVSCPLDGIGCGTVYELSPPLNGGNWTETTLHAFNFNFPESSDGASPVGGVVFDSLGNIYGTTSFGGDYECSGTQEEGCGIVFELQPPTQPGGGWTEEILHTFTYGDGALPMGNLLLAHGALAGTTLGGGGNFYGVVFEITLSGTAPIYTVLYNFQGFSDGGSPVGGLVADPEFNLYGTTAIGGGRCQDAACGGTVFELSPPVQQGGAWTKKLLYAFQGGSDGNLPDGSLILGHGWLAGLAEYGGGGPCSIDDDFFGCGVAFAVPK